MDRRKYSGEYNWAMRPKFWLVEVFVGVFKIAAADSVRINFLFGSKLEYDCCSDLNLVNKSVSGSLTGAFKSVLALSESDPACAE